MPAEWVFVYGNLGDCKAFHYNPRTGHIGDITPEARVNNDASDCGGRLGPYVNGEHPDLRNFRLRFMPCCTGDLIFVLSDGVYDNLDPEHLGKTPQEMGLDAESWDDAPFLEAEKLRLKFRLELLRQIILPEYQAGNDNDDEAAATTLSHAAADAEDPLSKEEKQHTHEEDQPASEAAKSGGTVELKSRATPKVITDEDRRYAESSPTDYRAMKPHHITWSLLEQTLKTNTAAIQWMEANPGKPLQSNYKKFPGKMDHTTCASFRVGFLSPDGKIISSEEAAQSMPPRTAQVAPPGSSSSSSSSSLSSSPPNTTTSLAGAASGASELRKSGGKGTGTGTAGLDADAEEQQSARRRRKSRQSTRHSKTPRGTSGEAVSARKSHSSSQLAADADAAVQAFSATVSSSSSVPSSALSQSSGSSSGKGKSSSLAGGDAERVPHSGKDKDKDEDKDKDKETGSSSSGSSKEKKKKRSSSSRK